MSNSPLSISYFNDSRPALPALHPDFHLRDLQNTHWGEEEYDFDPDAFEFSIDPIWQEIAKPKFKPGSVVSINTDLNPQSFEVPNLSAKGWCGRVETGITDGDSNFFVISLDSKTIDNLPEKYLKEIVELADGDNPFLFEIPEEALKAVTPRDTETEALNRQKLTYHSFFWGNIRKDAQAKRMFRILTRDYNDDDLGNWLYHFQHEVKYPIPAEVEGLLMDEIAPGTKVHILGIEGVDPKGQSGLIGSVQKGRTIRSYPLSELVPLDEEDPIQAPLSDYRYWADFSLV
jgi:hypothetical protein